MFPFAARLFPISHPHNISQVQVRSETAIWKRRTAHEHANRVPESTKGNQLRGEEDQQINELIISLGGCLHNAIVTDTKVRLVDGYEGIWVCSLITGKLEGLHESQTIAESS
ncbi:hypothetical protein N7449_009676 [Penicillium cf. viridicatum]|uniref:Uncharacterized protein n=1 Tax=Penicillium cf. viridicatum TaxID=2972119 RepID=A0A9W9JBT6_9EURO|nr:hypothetical protein N7449_009676 [Penicillium cf. viridicatum]